MNFNGNWIDKKNDEMITFSHTTNDDEYILDVNDSVKGSTSETINIFITNEKHSLIPYSKRFGRAEIIILAENKICINNARYIRI